MNPSASDRLGSIPQQRNAVRISTERIPCQLWIQEDNVASFRVDGFLLNLSATGCLVELSSSVALNRVVHCRFSLNPQANVLLQAQMVRAHPHAGSHLHVLLGLQFVFDNEAAQDKLFAWVFSQIAKRTHIP